MTMHVHKHVMSEDLKEINPLLQQHNLTPVIFSAFIQWGKKESNFKCEIMLLQREWIFFFFKKLFALHFKTFYTR